MAGEKVKLTTEDILPVWKKVYPVISGDNSNITDEVIKDLLTSNKEKLIQNLLEYKPYKKESFKTWRNQSGLKDLVSDDELCNFIHLLSRELDLEVNVTWMVMCNFLMFEYYGHVDELKLIVKYDTNMKHFIDAVWYFYSGERMFLLKTLRYIFENASNKDHIFYKELSDFINSLNKDLLTKNLLEAMKNLINEIDKDKAQMVSYAALDRWIHRNHREQIEVLLLLIHVIQHCELDKKMLKDVLPLFLKHGFGRYPSHPKAMIIAKPKDLTEIKYAEIGFALAIMNYFWKNPGVCELLPKDLEENYELLECQTESCIVIFAWATLKISVAGNEEAVEYINRLLIKLFEKKVFLCLYKLITNEIFAKNKAGDFVIDAVYQLMTEFCKLVCDDIDYIFDQECVSEIVAELIRRKGIVVLDTLGPLFERALETFPYVLTPFLEICKALLEIPEKNEIAMDLLRNVPSFLAEIPWDDHRDTVTLTGPKKLFIDSHMFVIPIGTTVVRCNYKIYEMSRFLYPFSFFKLMTQFIVSLNTITSEIGTGWYCYNNLKELVRAGFDFIDNMLKQYKGDFRSDIEIRTLVQRLDVVPTQFCEGPAKNFDLIRLYFRVNTTLITRNMINFSEAFPILLRKKCFPLVTDFENINKQMMIEHVHGSSILINSLKEEEGENDHILLLTYLDLVQHAIQNEISYGEVQAAGVWYMLNVVFPLYQQWTYDNPHQAVLICKACLTCFAHILGHYENKQDNGKYIYKMVVNTFLFEKLAMNSYVSIFLKDKYHIQGLMEQESNWLEGPTLEHIKCVKLQLRLLLLLYEQKIKIKSVCSIDDKISEISRAVSAYIVNPYSVALRILSCKFLEILSKDENAPLMALLGFDYDQVQRVFLDRLRDPTEDDGLKMHILELISNCIFHQHGMTAAFFNVKSSRKWYSDNRDKTIEGDTVGDFMVDYLQNIKRSHEYLRHPLQIGILRVVAHLWISGKYHLIGELISLKLFWPLLSEPLFCDFNQLPSVYTNILRIYTVQLHEPQNSANFLSQVEKFVTNKKQMELWERYIIGIFKTETSDEAVIKERRDLLEIWTEFLVILEKQTNIRKFDKNTKRLFIEMSIGGVHTKLVNMYCLDSWMNLAMIQLSNWGIHESHKDKDLVVLVKDMFSVIKIQYSTQKSHVRSTILAFAYKLVVELKKHFEENDVDLLEFLESLGPIVDYEYDVLENDVWKDKNMKNREKALFLPWMMCFNIINEILKFKNAQAINIWLVYHNHLHRTMITAMELMSNRNTLRMVKVPIFSMLLYMRTPMWLDILPLLADLKMFYNHIEEPIAWYLNEVVKVSLLTIEEVWSTLNVLMKFNQIFMSRLQAKALPTFYTFQTIFEKVLDHIWGIPQTNVALKALELLANTLKFYDTVLNNWQEEWYKKHNVSYNKAMTNTGRLINACIYNILRPKDILLYTLDECDRLVHTERTPIELMVQIMNRLITAAGLGFSMLYKMNPGLVELLNYSPRDTSIIAISNDFSVPKFDLPISHNLAYGKLLCLAHFLCKALDALHNDKSEPDDKQAEKLYSTGWVGLVEHRVFTDHLPHQELSTYLRYTMYEYSGLADPWIQKLDQNIVRITLETFMVFLGQQIFLTNTLIEPTQRPYFKRNLISELQFFFEYVKKHTMAVAFECMSSAGPSQGPSISKSDMDMFKRYLVHRKQNGSPITEVLSKNFCVCMCHWFTHICHLQ
ncbi:unnamed protein product [Callosobruchus maculatus]|uniref:Nucleoporin Nup188 N-terminal domain-containing protein n=1 Tax=Callosobruchus maculatus TaxID=64391 RepID=A0A653CYI7_CALMS|nr:unnamed protein product [Callosobruchus maculatus]